jgi:Ni2+-binding GTPase involved in maturation of urease and hydrogenase
MARRNVERVAPNARILEVSARSGAGMERLVEALAS